MKLSTIETIILLSVKKTINTYPMTTLFIFDNLQLHSSMICKIKSKIELDWYDIRRIRTRWGAGILPSKPQTDYMEMGRSGEELLFCSARQQWWCWSWSWSQGARRTDTLWGWWQPMASARIYPPLLNLAQFSSLSVPVLLSAVFCSPPSGSRSSVWDYRTPLPFVSTLFSLSDFGTRLPLDGVAGLTCMPTRTYALGWGQSVLWSSLPGGSIDPWTNGVFSLVCPELSCRLILLLELCNSLYQFPLSLSSQTHSPLSLNTWEKRWIHVFLHEPLPYPEHHTRLLGRECGVKTRGAAYVNS